MLLPLIFIAPNVYSATEHPSGVVEQPDFLQGQSNKFILIILDIISKVRKYLKRQRNL